MTTDTDFLMTRDPATEAESVLAFGVGMTLGLVSLAAGVTPETPFSPLTVAVVYGITTAVVFRVSPV